MQGSLEDRSKQVVAFSIAFATCGAFFSPLYFFLGSRSGAIAILVSDVLILLAPYILKKSGSFKIAGNWVIFNVYWLLAYLATVNGGQGGPSLYLNVSLPLAATMIAGFASGCFWTLMLFLEFLIFYYLTLTGYPFRQDFSPQAMQMVQNLSLMFLGVIVLMFSYLYEYFNGEAMNFIRSLSVTDELTKLYNRRGFLILAEDRLKTAAREKNNIILLYLDIDGLKQVNDKKGHLEGDVALINAAHILKDSLRKSDMVARIGGDEFVILAAEKKTQDGEVLVRRIRENFAQFNRTSGLSYALGLSSGICYWRHDSPCSIEELLQEADRKMYEEKRSRNKN